MKQWHALYVFLNLYSYPRVVHENLQTKALNYVASDLPCLTLSEMKHKKIDWSSSFIDANYTEVSNIDINNIQPTIRRQTHHVQVIWKQSKSEGFDSCDRSSNRTQIGLKPSIFQPVCP